MKISGKERALIGEQIVLNISLLKEGISKILLSLDESIKLKKTFNYDLDRIFFTKKKIEFEVSKFEFKNNLVLGFMLEDAAKKRDNVSLIVSAVDVEEEVKEMSVFDIEILKPEVQMSLSTGDKPGELKFTLEKKRMEITTYFEELEVSAKEISTDKPVKIEIIRFSEEEFIDNLDKIPIIFNIDTAIKTILIHSNKFIELRVVAHYFDIIGNKYSSNKATIEFQPFEKEEEKEFITTPIFETFGFEYPQLAVASS